MNAATTLDHGTTDKKPADSSMPDWARRDWTGLKAERDGHVAVVTFDNPPAHTWTVHSLAALRDLVRALDADRNVVALVITGSGPKFFCAGADLKQFADGDKAVAHEAARRFGEAFEALSAFRGVSIAAINGYAAARTDASICSVKSSATNEKPPPTTASSRSSSVAAFARPTPIACAERATAARARSSPAR